MRMARQLHVPLRGSSVVGVLAIIFSGFAQGAEISPAQAKALKAQLNEQAKRMETLRKQLADADAKLLAMQKSMGVAVPPQPAVAVAAQAKSKDAQPMQVAQAAPVAPAAPAPRSGTVSQEPAQVGESPPQRVQQVAQILKLILGRGKPLETPFETSDASDAVALALCHAQLMPRRAHHP